MKKLAVFVVVAIAVLVAFNYATTGELTLAPSFSKSEEEREVQDLQRDFAAAQKQYAQAYRAAGLSGIDTTADADAAIESVKRVTRELESLRKRLSEVGAKRSADELAIAVGTFQKNL
jgi:alcohol dehydrogenase class IV